MSTSVHSTLFNSFFNAILRTSSTVSTGVILISEDLDEILSLSDRIMVIYDGELKAVETHDRETIGLMMAGEAA